MPETDTTHDQLIAENTALRQRIAALEAAAAEHAQIKEALQESEARYRLLAEHVTDVIWVRDMQLFPTYISPSVTRLRGYSVEEAMSQTLLETLTPASREVVQQAFAHALTLERSGQAPPDRSRALELEVTRKDGSTVWIETNVTFLRDAEGRPEGFIGVNRDISTRKQAEQALQQAHDELEQRVADRTAALQRVNTALEAEITERQQAEAALRASEQRYRQLVDGSQGLLCTHDLDGIVLSVNPAGAKILGYEPHALVGKNIRAFLASSVHHLFDPYLERLRRHGTARGLMRVVTHTGDERVLTYHNRLIEDAGEVPYVLGHAQDITDRVHAEEALRASEAKFRDLIEGSIQGIMIHRDGCSLFVNQAFATIFGYGHPHDVLTTLGTADLIAPHERARLHRYQQDRLAGTEVPTHYEYQGQRQDGAVVWLESRVRVIIWDGLPAIQSTVVDITERTQAAEAIRQSEERFRQLAEGSIQGMMIHRAGTPVFANQAYAEIYGYDTPEDVLRVENIFQDIIAPEDRARLEQYCQARLRGEPVPTHYTCRGVRRDGRAIWVENIVTVVTWWGATAIQCTVVDISERKRTEEALRASEERYRTLVDQAADGILIADPHGQYIEVNASGCAMLGYTREELLGRRVGDLVPPDDLAGEPLHLDALSRGEVVVSARRLTRKDGTLLPVEISAKILSDRRLQCIMRDITERTQAEDERHHLEAQLHQSQKLEALGTLAGGIAHEFNNILAAILGFTEMATLDLPPTHPVSPHLHAVLTAGRRAKDLVQQILTFSRHSDLARHPVQIAVVLQEVLHLLRASFPTTIAIQHHCAPETGTVLADATQLHQVLLNLCTNAAYAMRDTGGILEIGVDTVESDAACAAFSPPLQPGSYVRVTVRDTGAGIPADVMERIFEPFFTTKEVGEGTGMGLAIVHGIVTSHGGAIAVESTLGAGSTFTIALPQIAEVAASDAPPPVADLPQGQGRLLFVDDEEMLARWGEELLAHLGYEVVAHTSSLEALAAFRATPDWFDLVITDQTMPGMTGATLVKALRRIRPDIPIILCTGFSHLVNAETAQALGVDAFVMKPGVTQELAVTIQQVLEKRAAQET